MVDGRRVDAEVVELLEVTDEVAMDELLLGMVLEGATVVELVVDVTVDGRSVNVDDVGLLDVRVTELAVDEEVDGRLVDDEAVDGRLVIDETVDAGLLDDGTDDVLVTLSDVPGLSVVPSTSLPDGSVESVEPVELDPFLQLGTADS